MKVIAVAAAAIATTLFAGAADAQVQERTIRWGHLNNTDHPVSLGVQKFAEILAAKSGGKLKVREFPASQLGNEMQMQSALRGGTQDMMSAATTSLASVVKEFGLLDFPFIVATAEQADALVTGPFGQAMLAVLPEKDLIGLDYWGLGFRNATNSSRSIAKVEDFAGLKLRVIPNPVFLETFKALKANPVPMNFGELYTALENKTVDGQENPYSVILSNKFYEVRLGGKSRFHAEHPAGQQEILGQALAGRAEDDARDRGRDAQLSARADAHSGGQGAGRAQGQGDDLQRDCSGRACAHATGDEARCGALFRRFRPGQGEAVQRRAGARPQGELGAPSPPTWQQRARPRWAGSSTSTAEF
jgi:tripartite ATP-independent transporter DctP family solute receptor